MDLLLTRKTLGSEFDMVISDDEVKIRHDEELPAGLLQVPSARYHEIRKLYGLPWRTFPPKRFRKPYEALLEQKGISLPWKKLIPHTIYQKELEAFTKGLQTDFAGLDTSYHTDMFEPQTSIFYALERAAVDLPLINTLLRENECLSSSAVLKTFSPTGQIHGVWYAPPISYERIASVTGRLKIRKGPGILHLKKDFRRCITSRWGDKGSVYYLDYKSLEPRLLLALREPGVQLPKDPYMYAATSMGIEGEIDRQHIKTAVISMIYGAGDKELIRQLKPHIAYPEDFISSVKERFGVDELKERLKAEYEVNKGQFILNHYGRPVHCEGTAPYVLVNYFIQSSAVDLALFGFSKIVDKLIKTNAIDLIKPLYVLHDALILDVHDDVIEILAKLASLGAKDLPRLEGTKFWIETERLDNGTT